MNMNRKFYRLAGLSIAIAAALLLVVVAYKGIILAVISATVSVVAGSFLYLTNRGEGEKQP